MNQEFFASCGQPRWRAFADLLDVLEQGKSRGAEAFPALYRTICSDLALARERRFDAHIVDRLNTLALRGHRLLYGGSRNWWPRILSFWAAGFPRAVRREARLLAASVLVFVGSGAAVGSVIMRQPELVYGVMDHDAVAGIEEMYDPKSEHHLRPRGYETDAAMFGFYIKHNIGIGFETFATGVFFGLGSLFILFFNGVFLGAVTGHLVNVGFGLTFFPFVVGHSSLELTAVVLAGTAGLRLGWSLVAPNRLPRVEAVRAAARRALPLVYGCAGMLLGAAAIEAFWSSSHAIPAQVKFGVGALLWATVMVYFGFVGRGRGY